MTTTITPDDKVLAVLSYLFVLCLVPLLLKRQRGFVQWHVRQGFLLFLAEVIIMLLSPVPLLGWLIAFIGWITVAVLSILGMVAALVGKYWLMPILGKYAHQLKI